MAIYKKKYDFSNRELQVLSLVKEGLTSRQIAGILALTEDTVENHRKSMMKKTGAKNMIVVVYGAKSLGLI